MEDRGNRGRVSTWSLYAQHKQVSELSKTASVRLLDLAWLDVVVSVALYTGVVAC